MDLKPSGYEVPEVPVFLNRYREVILACRGAAVGSPLTRMAATGSDEIFYTPFEWVNEAAKLIVVGITPGPNQVRLAYDEAARALEQGATDEEVLARAKVHGAFGSATMRPNLVRMMNHLGFARLFGLANVEELWGKHSDLFLGTSVIPHAAFRRGKPFAGSFKDVLKSPVLSDSFRRDFVPSLAIIPQTAMFVALGPTPMDALTWCVAEGLLNKDQVLGAFAHPSSNGGSSVDAYLQLRTQFDPNDPVRHRLKWLCEHYERMKETVALRLPA